MRLTIKEVYQHRETIIHTVFHLLCDSEIKSASLSENAIKAEVSNHTIYHYFDWTEQIVVRFAKCRHRIMQNMLQIVEDIPYYAAVAGYG